MCWKENDVTFVRIIGFPLLHEDGVARILFSVPLFVL